MQFVNTGFLSFNELRELQNLTQDDFDARILKIGFKFSHLNINEFWKNKIYVYEPNSIDKIKPITRMERSVDTVYFGKRRDAVLIITVSVITNEESYYKKLLAQCKKESYTLWSTNNFDKCCPNMRTEEYRNKANIVKFSSGTSLRGVRQLSNL